MNSERARLREIVQELETNLDILRNENEKISVNNIERLKEMNQLKAKLQSEESKHVKEINEYTHKLDQYRKAHLDSRELSIKFSTEKSSYEAQIIHLKQILDNNKAETARLYDLIAMRKRDIDVSQAKVEELQKENSSLKEDRVRLESDIELKNESNDLLSREVAEATRMRDEYKSQVENHANEWQQRRDDVIEKTEQLESAVEKYLQQFDQATQLNEELLVIRREKAKKPNKDIQNGN
eukprot:TRINITY_DN3494_c0_g1_i3.p1 TRINITY_DN3494_c0_g1~~TRINITY_DN3494_c0_g1_i3.p1  ORF type:complete len:239 (-),score=64.10 TRINITY_DN3494_c0_g1_i3:96-812(-)